MRQVRCKEDYQVARLIRARHDFNFNAAIEEFCSSTGTECANGFFSTYDDCEKFLKWLEENGIRPVAYPNSTVKPLALAVGSVKIKEIEK